MKTPEQIACDLVNDWATSERSYPKLTWVIAAAIQAERDDARHIWRKEIHSKWGGPSNVKCDCAYCRRDIALVFDHAAQLEMDNAYLGDQIEEAVKLLEPFAGPVGEDCRAAREFVEKYKKDL